MARPDPLLSVRDAAEILGVSRNIVYVWARESRVPCFKLNGVLRFKRADLEAWMEDNRRGPLVAAAR
jgi:excisionase family DNA binding protein